LISQGRGFNSRRLHHFGPGIFWKCRACGKITVHLEAALEQFTTIAGNLEK